MKTDIPATTISTQSPVTSAVHQLFPLIARTKKQTERISICKHKIQASKTEI